MTVTNTQIAPARYAGDGTTRTFTVPFRVLADNHLEVVILRDDDTEAVLALGDHYTVDGVGNAEASVTLTTAPAAGETLTIIRDVPPTQETDYRAGDAFPAETHERGLDKATMLIQQIMEALERTLKLPVSSTIRNIGLPLPSPNLFLAWNAAGTALINRDPAISVIIPPSTVTIKFPADLGLAADGVNDDSVKLNAEIDALSAAGGGVIYLLAPGPNGSFKFENDVVVKSFVTLIFASPVKLNPGVGIRIAGSRVFRSSTLRMVSNASSGVNTITVDTGPLGGGDVSTHLAVGQRIRIDGLRSATGVSLEFEENIITGIDDGTRTLTLLRNLSHSYQVQYPAAGYEATFGTANVTTISVPRQASLTADVTALNPVVTVAAGELTDLAVGDWVIVEAENRTSSNIQTHVEIAQIVDIGADGANTVRLSRMLRRAYTTAQYAKLYPFSPALRASVQGASVQFIGAAAPTIGSVFNIALALDCEMIDCEVPNTDAFGTRATMFRFDRSYNCRFIRPTGRNPKFTGSGEGYGLTFAYSTACHASEPTFAGCRHDVQYLCATECGAHDVVSQDCRLTSISFHGCNSVGCYALLKQLVSQTRTASASNGAVIFGNPSHDAGDHECWVMGGEIGPWRGTSGHYCVRFDPPSSFCYVIGTRFRTIRQLLIHRDVGGAGGRISSNCGLINCSVDDCEHYLFDCNGGANGAVGRTLSGLLVRNLEAVRCRRGGFFDQCENVVFDDCSVEAANPDSAAPYFLNLVDVPGLELWECQIEGFIRGLSLVDCPSHRVIRTDFIDQTETIVRHDGGGNNGGMWRYVDTIGFNGTLSGSGSTITDHPVPWGGEYIVTV